LQIGLDITRMLPSRPGRGVTTAQRGRFPRESKKLGKRTSGKGRVVMVSNAAHDFRGYFR